jgi:hypothetical protein
MFYAREPYSNIDAVHVTRFIGLAPVGNKDKKVCFLSITSNNIHQAGLYLYFINLFGFFYNALDFPCFSEISSCAFSYSSIYYVCY